MSETRLETRLVDLETRLAEDARTIDELDTVVHAQWDEIDRLRRRVDDLELRIQALAEALAELDVQPAGGPSNRREA